jgi:hypothetical protein
MEVRKRDAWLLNELATMTYWCEFGRLYPVPGMNFRLPGEGHLFFRGAETGNAGRVFRNGRAGARPPYFSMMSFFESAPVLVSSL